MENITIKLQVPTADWSNATALANNIRSACTLSGGDEFNFMATLVGEKAIPAGKTTPVTTYSVKAEIRCKIDDFSDSQAFENTIYLACDSHKKSGEKVTFATYSL